MTVKKMPARRDKTKGQHTMLDQLKQEGFDPRKAQNDRIDANIKPSIYTKEYMEQVAKYNETVTQIDPTYSKLQMVGSLLVRCYMYEVEVSEAGLIEANMANIEVMNPSGHKSNETVEVTVPYSLKAVIVSAPKELSLFPSGTIVQLKPGTVKNTVVGDSKGGFYVYPTNAFVLVGKHDQKAVSEVTSPDFGYVVIGYNDIQCILDTPVNVEQD